MDKKLHQHHLTEDLSI
jgi:hypothetical protein